MKKYFRTAICDPPCQNKGKCIKPGKPGICLCDDKFFYGDQCENKKDDRCNTEPDIPNSDLDPACNQTKCRANCTTGYKFSDRSNDIELICKGGIWEINRINKIIPECIGEIYFSIQSNLKHNN